MNTNLLPEKAISIIDQYEHFSVGSAVCSVPYYNNRRYGARAKLRAQIGKGSPQDIFDEAESVAISEKINLKNLDSGSLKKFLTDRNIGIDCSGLVYHVLEIKNLSFPFCGGVVGKLRCKIRPVENADVATFAHDRNSRRVEVKEVEVGDIITMIGKTQEKQRDHIVLIYQIECENFVPTILHYVHAIAWPTDGEYGHGVRRGTIEIIDPEKTITEQRWIEAGKTGVNGNNENYTFTRAKDSETELRRLKFL